MSSHPPHGIRRRQFVKTTSTAALATAFAFGSKGFAESETAKGPNIVFVFSDEHRWCSLPFTEMPEVIAPNMSLLAKQGTRFDNCCSTSPICVPYRGMLLTGMWPLQSSCVSDDTFLDGDIIGRRAPTLAHTFGKAGYTTGYVGKWHLKTETAQQAGFDYFKHWL